MIKATCPLCAARVIVMDPQSKATPWIKRHRDPATRRICDGSYLGVSVLVSVSKPKIIHSGPFGN